MSRTLKTIGLLALLTALSACGFRPLYGENSLGASLSQELSGIQVAESNSINGVKLRNELLDSFQPKSSANAEHILSYSITESRTDVGTRIDASATRYNYRMTTNYNLRNIKTGESVYKGRAISNVTYDVNNDQFATVIARQAAKERAIKEVSENIKLRLALYFESKSKDKQDS